MQSIVVVAHPLLACLLQILGIFGGDGQWSSTNQYAQQFFKSFTPDASEMALLPEMKAKASKDAKEINRWLKSEGFSIKLPPEGELFVASVMKLAMQWLESGQVTSISYGEKEFAGVQLKDGVADIVYREGNNDDYVVIVNTKNGKDVAYFYVPQETPKSQMDVVKAIAKMDASLLQEGAKIKKAKKFVGVRFPQINLDVQPDVSWLEGARTMGKDGRPAVISCCKQQIKMTLDTEGAKVETAAAMAVTRSLGPVPFTIDKPFLFWIRREGVNDPLIHAFLCPDTWVKK